MPGARERIVDAYVELLGLRGRSGVAIKELVSRAGVSRQAFYYHFRDLGELEHAVAREFVAGLLRSSKEAIGDASSLVDLDSMGMSAMGGWEALTRRIYEQQGLACLLVGNAFQQVMTEEFLAMSGTELSAVPYTRDERGRELGARCMGIVAALNPYYTAYVLTCCVEYLVRTGFRDKPEDAAEAFYRLFMPRLNP